MMIRPGAHRPWVPSAPLPGRRALSPAMGLAAPIMLAVAPAGNDQHRPPVDLGRCERSDRSTTRSFWDRAASCPDEDREEWEDE